MSINKMRWNTKAPGDIACRLFIIAQLICAGATMHAQQAFTRNTTILVDVDRRPQVSLNGDWHYIPDPNGSSLYDSNDGSIRDSGYARNARPSNEGAPVEYDFSKSPTLKVPGDWNTQRVDLFRYEGPLWYEKDFQYWKDSSTRVFLHVGAANYRSVVWMNGHRVCQHEGGYTPFDCEVTATIQDGTNFVVIAVDSTRLPDGVPGAQTDWYNYGGLTRDVSLVELPQTFVDDYDLHLERNSYADISGSVHVVGAPTGTEVRVVIPEARVVQTARIDQNGTAIFQVHARGLELWSPDHPKLYQVRIETGLDSLSDEVGFRSVEVRGTDILLNGKPIFLRGISLHAEAPLRTGRVCTDEDVQTIFGWVHDLSANFVRLAHYPHDPRMMRIADRLGILVWSETPDWQRIHFSDPRVLELARQELTEMIRRDRARASIILWSVANETFNQPDRNAFLTTLVQQAHQQDPTRPVTAAFPTPPLKDGKRTIDDPLAAVLDVIGMNEYIGWYQGKPEDAEKTQWVLKYEKPLIISELGAEAKAGFHGSASIRWTEESQADIYRHQLGMLQKIPELRGLSPWILMDFRSPTRNLSGLQDGFNRKGLVSENGEKKLAFQVLEEAYRTRLLDTGK